MLCPPIIILLGDDYSVPKHCNSHAVSNLGSKQLWKARANPYSLWAHQGYIHQTVRPSGHDVAALVFYRDVNQLLAFHTTTNFNVTRRTTYTGHLKVSDRSLFPTNFAHLKFPRISHHFHSNSSVSTSSSNFPKKKRISCKTTDASSECLIDPDESPG